MTNSITVLKKYAGEIGNEIQLKKAEKDQLQKKMNDVMGHIDALIIKQSQNNEAIRLLENSNSK